MAKGSVTIIALAIIGAGLLIGAGIFGAGYIQTQRVLPTPTVEEPTATPEPTSEPTMTPKPTATPRPIPTTRPTVKIQLRDGEYYCYQDKVNELANLTTQLNQIAKTITAPCMAFTEEAYQACHARSTERINQYNEVDKVYQELKKVNCP